MLQGLLVQQMLCSGTLGTEGPRLRVDLREGGRLQTQLLASLTFNLGLTGFLEYRTEPPGVPPLLRLHPRDVGPDREQERQAGRLGREHVKGLKKNNAVLE